MNKFVEEKKYRGKVQAVILDWDTENRGEPFFSETCSMEWDEVLKKIGFINTQSFGLGKMGYPWVDIGTKPL